MTDCSTSNLTVCTFPVRDSLPWYWDEQYTEHGQLATGIVPTEREGETIRCAGTLVDCKLLFEDKPSCHVLVAVPCVIRFTTTLVGVKEGNGSGDALNIGACQTGAPLSCLNNVGTGFNWHVLGASNAIDGRLQSSQPDPQTTVFFDGFKPPGAAGFTQPELELFAKSGVNVRDESGVTIPIAIHITPNRINIENRRQIRVAIASTTGFDAPREVDQRSLTFGRTGDEPSLAFCDFEDATDEETVDATRQRKQGESDRTLVCHFYTSITAFRPSDTEGILKGKTFTGTPIFGMDSVRVIHSD